MAKITDERMRRVPWSGKLPRWQIDKMRKHSKKFDTTASGMVSAALSAFYGWDEPRRRDG